MCVVAESIALRLLARIGHPQADELARQWSTAWPVVPEQTTAGA